MRADLLQPAATITAALLRNEQTVGPTGIAEMLVAVYDQLVLAQTRQHRALGILFPT